jgi:secernin
MTMCDTVVVRRSGETWFAKNSDREPGEPQGLEVSRPSTRDGDTVRATWIEVAAPRRHVPTLLSRPAWMWGAEMGVNAAGVAIGNEAIMSRHRSATPGLLGMDLLRLGLECAETATRAVEVITDLLERHGQGGRAGQRSRHMYYDNSFLVADPHEAWQLETAGRQWAARRVSGQQGISNRLSIRKDHDRACATLEADTDVARTWDTTAWRVLAGATTRSRTTTRAARELGQPSLEQLAAILRTHRKGDDPLSGSNRDVCMHAMGPVRQSQTTASLVAHLASDGPRIVATAASAPCLSLFRPVTIDAPDRFGVTETDHWWACERVHRRALFDPDLRGRIRRDIAVTEPSVLDAVDRGDLEAAEEIADAFHRRHVARADLPGRRRPPRPAGLFWTWRDLRDGVPR